MHLVSKCVLKKRKDAQIESTNSRASLPSQSGNAFVQKDKFTYDFFFFKGKKYEDLGSGRGKSTVELI